MNSIIANSYIMLIAISYIFLWGRHYWLVHKILNNYMELNYRNEWNKSKEDTGWSRPNWATLYYSKAVYDFVWRSDEIFNDDQINILKQKIKRFIWEFPIFFVAAVIVAVFIIMITN